MKTYGLEEAAAFLHVSKDSMRDMADSGKVPAAKIGPTAGYRRNSAAVKPSAGMTCYAAP
ncbi:MAG TPA: helix-turn-helix domain-containing protein [Bryobacteraceae bacterium]|nr:helix-turn-helix domain-containing protein [Bryobacteraceae bacterium]